MIALRKNWLQYGLLILALATGCEIAIAEIVVVVSPQNPISSLSKYQVADIFLGRTARFPSGESVTPIDQSADSEARNQFYEEIIGKSPAQIRVYWSKLIFTGRGTPPPDISSIEKLKNLISEDPNAISYMQRESVDSSVKIVDIR